MRYLTSAQLPQYDTETVHVCGASIGLAAQNLRRHPMRCAHLAVVVARELLLVAGETKVADLDRPLGRQQDVLRLEVAMQDASRVQVLES